MRNTVAVALLLLLAAHLAGTASGKPGNTYYISPSGSDGKSGSLQSPWKHLDYAVEQAKPGDTILVRGGTYDEGEIWLRADYGHCGENGTMLTIKAYPGEVPVFVNGKRPFLIECDYLRVEGLHFRNGKAIGAGGRKRTTIQLVNNSFEGEGYAWAAIDIGGNNMLLEGNVCDIKGNTVGTQGHCFYITQGSNIIIRNNVVRGMTGYGIHVFDQRRSKDETYERVIKDVIIEGNVASNSEERAGIILAAYDHARIENVIVRNNIVFNNPMTGIYIPGEVKNVKIYNNTIFGNHSTPVILDGPPDEVIKIDIKNNIIDLTRTDGGAQAKKHVYVDEDNPTVTVENNLYWPGPARFTRTSDRSPVVGDPRFVNPAAGDFRLQRGSAAIDKATALADVPEDKAAAKRPQGPAPDMGAYEYR